jgi:polar amino acid transport system permease protein
MALTRTQRTRAFRGGQYAVLVIAVLLLAFLADWGQIAKTFFDGEAIAGQFPQILSIALVNTLFYTALGFALGLPLGLVIAMMRLSNVGPYRWIATAYVEVFRGVPTLLVFIALGYGVPIAFNAHYDNWVAVMLALGLVGAAYMSETIRAGITGVPQGQVEAARSLGMSPARAGTTVVLPQAFRIVLPPLTNELILLAKDSSLVYALGLTIDEYELTKWGQVGLTEYKSLTSVIIAGLCYMIITIPLGYLSRYLERRTGSGRAVRSGK